MGNQLGAIAPSEIFPVEHYLTGYRGLRYHASLGSTRFLKVARAKVDDLTTAGGKADEVTDVWITVKVFVIHDPSLPLKPHILRLKEVSQLLKSIPRCLPFEVLGVNDKAAVIHRPYLKYSLYDRINTRPFLLPIEKAWLAYQLLVILKQIHAVQGFHGDIKAENIVITSWQSLFLTDFASFKPVDLPVDNPADFAYFFDTSGKRKCYIAPERFTDSVPAEDDFGKEPGMRTSAPGFSSRSSYQPAMDIFAAGCVLAELFTEGECLFDLSQLLAYKYGKYQPEQILSMIDDPHRKKLVCDMIHVNPSFRLSAEACLAEYEETIFPKYFAYWFDFIQRTFDNPSVIMDYKVSLIRDQLSDILDHMGDPTQVEDKDLEELNALITTSLEGDYFDSPFASGWNMRPKESSGIVLVAAVVTSAIRGLHFSSTRLTVLEILEEITSRMADDLVLDRVVPFMVELVKDSCPRVRAEALNCLTRCLARVEPSSVTTTDANIFPEFIFPEIAATVTDPHAVVRCSLAANIAVLAETAQRFIESAEISRELPEKNWSFYSTDGHSSIMHLSGSPTDFSRRRSVGGSANPELLRAEKRWIHEWVRDKVSALLADSDNAVKITLMRKNLTRLCLFFGRTGANDVIFSHMITFLNDKDDTKLRLAFYETIVGVVSYIGQQCSSLLKPLLLQGLSDAEEFVTAKALCAMMCLVETGLLDKYLIFELVERTAPFLCHPNAWVREAVVGFVSTVADHLTSVDVDAKITPLLLPYLKNSVTYVREKSVLWDALREPIPRNVFYQLLKVPNLSRIFVVVEAHELAANPRSSTLESSVPLDNTVVNFVNRLYSDGLSHRGRSVLIAMKDNLLKVHAHLQSCKSSLGPGSGLGGYFSPQAPVDMDRVPKRHMDLCVGPLQKRGKSPAWDPRDDVFGDEKRSAYGGPDGAMHSGPGMLNANMNREWMHMFGESEKPEKRAEAPPEISVSSPAKDSFYLGKTPNVSSHDSMSGSDVAGKLEAHLESASVCPPPNWNPSGSTLSDDGSLRISQDKSLDNNFVEYRCKPCRLELKELVKRREQDIAQDFCNGLPYGRPTYHETFPPLMPTGLAMGSHSDVSGGIWAPSGKLLSHVHDHRAGVTRLAGLVGLGEGGLFVSSSADGTVRLWDAGSDNLRSRLLYNCPGVPIYSVCWCPRETAIATMTAAGTIDVLSLEPSSMRRALIASRTIHPEDEGVGMDLMYLPTASMVIYVSSFGVATGWDLRTKDDGFRITQDLRHGVCTCACVEPCQQWLAIGTTGGVMTCYDLRFRLPAGSVTHPGRARVRRMLAYPVDGLSGYPSGSVIASFKGNNEVAVWNFETQSRQMTLWASPTPPLSTTQATHHSVCAICPSPSRDGLSWFLGSTDMRIRMWNTNSSSKSAMICTAGNDTAPASAFHYTSRLMEGCQVIVEGLDSGPTSEEFPLGSSMGSPKLSRRSGASHSGSSSSSGASLQYHSHSSVSLGSSPMSMRVEQDMMAAIMPGQAASGMQYVKPYCYAPPPPGHHDGVSDLIVVSAPHIRPQLISCSRDGIIKAWK